MSKVPVRNSVINLATQALGIVAALICIPIAFRNLGAERFGLLTLVWGLLSYSIVFDLGTGPAVARATAASLVSDRGQRVAAILRAGMVLQTALGTIVGLTMIVVASTLVRLLHIPAQYAPDATRALYALGAAIPVVLITQSLQAVLEGFERFDLLAYARAPVSVAMYAIPAYGAVAGWTLAAMMLGMVFVRLLAVIALFAFYIRIRPPEQTGRARQEWRGLFQFGRWLAVSGVLTQVLLYLDRFLLSAIHGLTAVAHYAAPYDASSKLLTVPGAVGVAMFPGLAKDNARDRQLEARMRSRAAAKLIMGLLIPAGLVLVLVAGPLLKWWLGPEFGEEGIAAFRILVVAMVIHAAAFPPVIMIEAFGRSDVIARYYLLELVVYVPVVVVAITKFGVAGAAYTWVARTTVLTLWSHWYANRKL